MPKKHSLIIYLCLFFALASQGGHGQELGKDSGLELDLHPTDVVFWDGVEATVEGNSVLVGLRLRTEQNFSIYKKNLKISAPPGFALASLTAPTTRIIKDPMSEEEVEVYDGGDFLIEFKGFEPFKGEVFKVAATYLGCTERICLFPYTEEILIKVFHSAAAASSGAESGNNVTAGGLEQEFASQVQRGELTFFLLLLVLFLGGLATNLTPCVLPMIPITIRILAHQKHTPFLNACIYASGIILSYTLLGVIVAFTGGIFGALLANPYVNMFFAAVFTLFALSMLGFGNLAKLQELGSRITTGHPTLVNSFFMGIGAGLVAAPCTGPILGALIAFTARNPELGQAGIQFFTYSFGFALPYVFLGLAANRITRIKVSDKIQNGTKLLFAAVMLGLALYYLRIPAYKALEPFKPHWQTIAITMLVGGFALAGLFIHVLKLEKSRVAQTIPALILGIGFFAASQWLTGSVGNEAAAVPWVHSLEEGLATAKEQNKPLFIDGWAEWCEACKKMDATTFKDPDLVNILSKDWVAVKLDLTELTSENEELAARYGLQGLPTIVLLPPDGDTTKIARIVGWADAPAVMEELKKFKK